MLNEALKRIRQSNGDSISELARRIGVSKSHISEIENKKKNPSVEYLENFARFYSIPLSHILFFSENYSPDEGRVSRITREYLGNFILNRMS